LTKCGTSVNLRCTVVREWRWLLANYNFSDFPALKTASLQLHNCSPVRRSNEQFCHWHSGHSK